MANKQNDMGTGMKVGMGAAALAAAAAGAYYFYGTKDATKNRKAMKGWMVKAKGEVMEKMENLKDISQANYDDIVAQVVEKYKKVKTADPVEIAALAKELHGHWRSISSHINKKPATKSQAPKRKAVTAKRVR